MKSIKSKNSHGFNQIPLRILCKSKNFLLPAITVLFQKIYDQKTIPEQWKLDKVIAIFKKGSKSCRSM